MFTLPSRWLSWSFRHSTFKKLSCRWESACPVWRGPDPSISCCSLVETQILPTQLFWIKFIKTVVCFAFIYICLFDVLYHFCLWSLAIELSTSELIEILKIELKLNKIYNFYLWSLYIELSTSELIERLKIELKLNKIYAQTLVFFFPPTYLLFLY